MSEAEQANLAAIPRRDQTPPTPIETLRLSTFKSRVKEAIEKGLEGVNASRYPDMRFSTDPDQVGTNLRFSTFFTKCNTFAGNIKNLLVPQGFNATTVSKDVPEPLHLYDMVKEDEMEILVDPTIGQYIRGHNYFFVGTRQELHDLVVANKDKIIIGKGDNKDPEYWFDELWGWSSRPCDRVK
jgi:hypothetical protein